MLVRNAVYHRPFISIDSEGMNFSANDVIYNGVVYPDHRTFLWGAAGVIRITKTSAENPHGEFCDLPLHWLGHDDKRALTLVEILDWLTATARRIWSPRDLCFVRNRLRRDDDFAGRRGLYADARLPKGL